MYLQVVAGSFESLKKVENRNRVSWVKVVLVHFDFEALLWTFHLGLIVEGVNATTMLTYMVRAEDHCLAI